MDAIRLRIDTVWDDRNFTMSQAVVEPEGRRVHVTGQVAWTPDFEVVGPGDAGRQAHVAIDNIEKILGALGGTIDDVVSKTMYYVRDADLPALREARQARFSVAAGPAVTSVKVAGLVDPDLLVEFAVIAVIPPNRFKAPDA